MHLHTPPACPIHLGGIWSPGGLLGTAASGHWLRPCLFTYLFGVGVVPWPGVSCRCISVSKTSQDIYQWFEQILNVLRHCMNNELFPGENSSRGEEDLWSGLLRLQPQQIRPAQWKVGTHTQLNALVLHATLTYCIAHRCQQQCLYRISVSTISLRYDFCGSGWL